MESLRVTSCMAENTDFICRQITRYIAERLKIAAEFINGIPWQERERLLDAGQIHVCWICGLPYAWKADQRSEERRVGKECGCRWVTLMQESEMSRVTLE